MGVRDGAEELPNMLQLLTRGEVRHRGDGGCRRKLAASFSRTARRGEGGTGAGGADKSEN